MSEDLVRDPSFLAMLPKGKAPAARQPTVASGPMRLGDSGEEVKRLQKQLNELGESLLATGQYGPRTLEAVRRFQVVRGIQPANGMVDTATRRALDELEAQGNPQLDIGPPKAADWFHSSAQRVMELKESPPESVKLILEDGRVMTIEEGVQALNVAFRKVRPGDLDADDPRDLNVVAVNRDAQKRIRKGFLTIDDRKALAQLLKVAFGTLGTVEGERHDIMMVQGWLQLLPRRQSQKKAARHRGAPSRGSSCTATRRNC